MKQQNDSQELERATEIQIHSNTQKYDIIQEVTQKIKQISEKSEAAQQRYLYVSLLGLPEPDKKEQQDDKGDCKKKN